MGGSVHTSATTSRSPQGEEKQPDSETHRCPACGEQIWDQATKCRHCGTDFSWRRYLSFSNTTLALITALISVIASSAPAINLLLTPENSTLTSVFSNVSTSGETLSMLLSNSGRRTGVVNRVNVAIIYGVNRKEFSIFPTTKDDTAIAIEPGKTVLANFLFDGARSYWTPDVARNDLFELGSDVARDLLKDAECSVWVRGVNSDGSSYKANVVMGCQDHAFQMFRRLLAQAAAASQKKN